MQQGSDGFYAVIPAGGVGSRLWPLSRAASPKFLHDVTGSGQSLLQETYQRLAPIAGEDRIMIVTGDAHADAVREQLGALPEHNLVPEPEPRESTAAIGLAAAILRRREPDVIVGSFAADHLIRGRAAIALAIGQAIRAAQQGWITTIGITPTRPATGFGYIRTAETIEIARSGLALGVDSFVEKPDQETAMQYLLSGDYLWNAGMFISRADVLLDAIGRSEPELRDGLEQIAEAWDTDRRSEVMRRVWPTLKKVAIDFSVAEPVAADGKLLVVPGHFTWDDVGDYGAIARALTGGGELEGIETIGDPASVEALSSNGLVINRSGRTIGVIGMWDVVIVDTPDALLVTRGDHSQQVKQLVEQLKLSHPDVL